MARMPIGIRPYQSPLVPPPPPAPLRYATPHRSYSSFHMQNTPAPQSRYEKHFAGRGRGRGAGAPGAKDIISQPSSGLKGPWQKTERKEKKAQTKVEGDTPTKANQSNGVAANDQEKVNSGASSTEAVIEKEKLPKELVEKFQPLKCDLCVVKMNSSVQAKMHYDGKQHLKKVRMFMVNWAKEKGQPMPKQVTKKKEEPPVKKSVDPEELYCKCCDLSFTSALHAQQHYMGRNHKRVREGLTPLRTGYYNKCTGKWQRFPPDDVRTVKPLITGNFQTQKKKLEEPSESTDGEPLLKKGRFFCDLCNVGATSQEQLDMHYNGAKHKKTMKSSGVKQTVPGAVCAGAPSFPTVTSTCGEMEADIDRKKTIF